MASDAQEANASRTAGFFFAQQLQQAGPQVLDLQAQRQQDAAVVDLGASNVILVVAIDQQNRRNVSGCAPTSPNALNASTASSPSSPAEKISAVGQRLRFQVILKPLQSATADCRTPGPDSRVS